MLQKCFTKLQPFVTHPDKRHLIGFHSASASFFDITICNISLLLQINFSNLKRFQSLIEIPTAYFLLRISFKKTKSRIFQRFEIFCSAFFLI